MRGDVSVIRCVVMCASLKAFGGRSQLLRGQSVSGEGSLAQFIMNRDVRSAWRRERSEVRRIINYYCEHVHLYNLQILYLTRYCWARKRTPKFKNLKGCRPRLEKYIEAAAT